MSRARLAAEIVPPPASIELTVHFKPVKSDEPVQSGRPRIDFLSFLRYDTLLSFILFYFPFLSVASATGAQTLTLTSLSFLGISLERSPPRVWEQGLYFLRLMSRAFCRRLPPSPSRVRVLGLCRVVSCRVAIKVRLAAESAESASAADLEESCQGESTSTAGCDVDVTGGGDSGSSAASINP